MNVDSKFTPNYVNLDEIYMSAAAPARFRKRGDRKKLP